VQSGTFNDKDFICTVKLLNQYRDHQSAVYCLCAVDEHHFFSGSADGLAVQWHVLEGQTGFAINVGKPIWSMAFDKSRNRLAVGTSEGHLHIIDLTARREWKHITQHQGGVHAIVIDEKTDRVYTAGADGNLGIWRSDDWNLERFIPLSDQKLRCISVIDENSIAVGGNDDQLRFFEPVFFNQTNQKDTGHTGITAMVKHPEKNVLLTAGKDAMIRVWDLSTFTEILQFPAHHFAIYRMAFSPANDRLATASRDKTVKIWNSHDLSFIEKLDLHAQGHTHSVNDVLWLGALLISCGDDRKICVWQ